MKCSLTYLRTTLLLCFAAVSLQAKTLDNFDDNTKTGWTDFTFVPGVGLPQEQQGQFTFALPGAVLTQVKSGLFSASQKTSETFELKEGRKIEFRVDVVKAGAKDSFAILGFLPTGTSPSTLSGYSIAKSTTDILISKGINKYFIADDSDAAELKNENVTLVLSLSVSGGNVIITGKVLDKENNNAVLWEKTVIDTPAADVLAAGTDNPATPFITSGYFTLFCYADYDAAALEDPYTATYDNAEVYITDQSVLDDFNDNTKTSWGDFTFVPGVGLPAEQNGEFTFQFPGAVLSQVKSGLFSASQKTSREFKLVEGERVEFNVDVVKAGAKDSFAILGFIPVGTSPSSLSGYSLAKSTTDILIAKGINKYFIADDSDAAELKNEKITLSLALTVKNGSVIIDARVLDKENNNAVMWQKSVTDTPAADVLAAGSDSPAAPFITSGYFTLFCYADYDAAALEDPYTVTFDNAVVFTAPVVANVAPIISEIKPAEFSSFLPASTQISFQVSDDNALANDKISITLNGTRYSSTNGLQITGQGNTRTVSLGGLASNVNYTAVLDVVDADGAPAARTIYFDTFLATNFTIEAEDYNFDGGSFVDNGVLIPEGSGPQSDAYSLQAGQQDIDFNETRTSPRTQDTLYRPSDSVRMNHTLDNARARFTAGGGAGAEIYDYDLQDIAAGEWLNYTRTIPAGSYEVYLREAIANMANAESVLELVTGDPKQPNQSTRVLGSFLGVRSGFQYRNFPLTDGSGLNKVVLQLSGATTLRLRQVTADLADSARYENYLILVPAAQTGIQRATLATLAPAGGSTVESISPAISATILNRDTTVKTDSIKLYVNDQLVSASVSPNNEGASLSYNIAPLPAPGSTVTSRLVFTDSQDVIQTNEWSFLLSYNALNPANRTSGSGAERGFKMRIVQAPLDLGQLDNSLARAEDQLAANSTFAKVVDTNFVVQVINFNQDGLDAGSIPGDQLIPGLEPDVNGTDNFAVEFQAYLELSAGSHRFGVVSDDGFSVRSGTSVSDKTTVPLSFKNGTADQTFDFLAPEAGLYPFRMVWYERGGGAHVEWFSVDMQTSERTLINDSTSSKAVKAYTTLSAGSALVLESSTSVNANYAADITATINSANRTITIPIDSAKARFYRLNGGSRQRIATATVSGGSLVLTFEPAN